MPCPEEYFFHTGCSLCMSSPLKHAYTQLHSQERQLDGLGPNCKGSHFQKTAAALCLFLSTSHRVGKEQEDFCLAVCFLFIHSLVQFSLRRHKRSRSPKAGQECSHVQAESNASRWTAWIYLILKPSQPCPGQETRDGCCRSPVPAYPEPAPCLPPPQGCSSTGDFCLHKGCAGWDSYKWYFINDVSISGLFFFFASGENCFNNPTSD